MKVEQTSELIKASNRTIQRLIDAIVGAMKINSQEITRSSVVPRSIYANQRQQVWWIPPTSQNFSVSRRFNAYLSTYEERSDMCVHPKSPSAYLTNFFCTRSIVSMCALRKAATHNWRIQVSGAQRKHKGSLNSLTTTSSQTTGLPKPFQS
jgi:hypothetical protein